jgi:hypothetical protein
MSEHEELVQELREVLGRIPDDIADNLPLTFLRSCLAVLQGSTEEKVCISRKCAENSITALRELHEITEWDCAICINELEVALLEKEQ